MLLWLKALALIEHTNSGLISRKGMRFHFVEHGDASVSKRKAARSHVMKGKNVGKILLSRSSKESARKRMNREQQPPDGVITAMRRLVGSDVSTFSPGIEMSPHSRLLFNQYFHVVADAIYPPELCQATDPLKSVWFEFLLNEKAFFHIALSVTATSLDFFQGTRHESAQALFHTTEAFGMLNQRLSGSEAVSDLSIALICMFVVQESLLGNVDKCKTHLHGLFRMVELRGGIKAFADNAEMVEKIYRVDIQFALHTGCQPLFYFDKWPTGSTPEDSFTGDRVFSPLQTVFEGASDVARQLTQDIESFSAILKRAEGTAKIAPHDFQSMVILVLYRLIRIQHEEEAVRDVSQEACVMGLVAFGSSLLLQFGRQRHLRYDLLSRRLKRAIFGVKADTLPSMSVLLWLSILGGISVFEIENEEWLLPMISNLSRVMGLHNWESTRSELQKFPWIDAIHCAKGKSLWESSQR